MITIITKKLLKVQSYHVKFKKSFSLKISKKTKSVRQWFEPARDLRLFFAKFFEKLNFFCKIYAFF